MDNGNVIGRALPILAVPMPAAPSYPTPYPFIAPKSETESGIRYLSYGMILFAITSAANIVLLFVLFPLIAAFLTTPAGSPPDPALFGSLFAVAGAGCAISLVSIIGAIFGLLGLVSVHRGGDEFGPEHSRRVERGLIVVIVGILVPLVGQAAVVILAAASSTFPGSTFVPTFNPVVALGQLAFGLVQVILLGLFLLWTVELLVTPSGLTRAKWAFILGIVGVGAGVVGTLTILAVVPVPTRLEEVTLWFLVPSAIAQGVSIASLLSWYLVYHGVLERFRRRELVARPPAMYVPVPPYYPGYYPAYPMPPSASPSQPQGPPSEGPPETPPGT